MSVSTPILTMSSEIWACAVLHVAASVKPAATAAMSFCTFFLPVCCCLGFVARLF